MGNGGWFGIGGLGIGDETDKVDLQIKPRPLDIKFKQNFREYLNKNQKIDVIEYNNIKLYKNK